MVVHSCSLAFYNPDNILLGDLPYVTSIWLILFNGMSYVSRCQYVKAHRMKSRILMLFSFVVSVLLFVLAVPIMACNQKSDSKVAT